MTLRGAPVLQEVVTDIETTAMLAKMAQERLARRDDSDDGSHGIHNDASGSTASHRSRQGVSASGRPGMSIPPLHRGSYIPSFPSSMPFAYGQDPATYDPVSAALRAAAEGSLGRPPRRPLAHVTLPLQPLDQGSLHNLLKHLQIQQMLLGSRHKMQRVEIVNTQRPPMLPI